LEELKQTTNKQLDEWKETANKLINSKADSEKWRQKFKDISADVSSSEKS